MLSADDPEVHGDWHQTVWDVHQRPCEGVSEELGPCEVPTLSGASEVVQEGPWL